MAGRRNSYSRMVAWLKVLLPLIALGVLATVFLFTREDSFEAGFTFSRADIATLETGSFINQPKIEGQTKKGDPFYLNATQIAPQNGDMNLLLISGLVGEFRFESNDWVKISAESAVMDLAAKTVAFNAGGTMETSDGNVAQVDSFLVRFDSGEMLGSGIVAQGPLGQVSADRFRIESIDGENRVLWFENNVKMRYDLQNESN